MIYDRLARIEQYSGISPNLDTAIAFVKKTELRSLPMGKTVINGDQVFLNHFIYSTSPLQPDSEFEDHTIYLDLHIILGGQEKLAVTPASLLHEVGRKEDEDSVIYHGEPSYELPMEAECFALLFPGEGHLPRLVHKSPAEVNKLVFKIAL